MATRRLSVVLDLDTGSYSGRLNAAGSQMRTFGGTVDKSSRSVRQFTDGFDRMGRGMSTPLQKLRDYTLVLGNLRLAFMNVRDLAFGWVGSLLQQSSAVERLTILMKGMSNATTEMGRNKEAQNNLSQLFDMARNTGFEMETLTDAFVKFRSAKLNPGDGSLAALANAVAAFGGTSDTMHRASIAIQQMAGKGVISMEELRQQLGEAVPTAMSDMARAMGKTVQELSKEVAKGTVAAGPALTAMFNEMERTYAGAGKRMSETMSGQLAQMKTNITQLSTDFTQLGNKDGLFSGATKALTEFNQALRGNEAREAMMALGNAVAAVGGGLVTAGKTAIYFREEIGGAVKVLAAGIALLTAKRFGSWILEGVRDGVAGFRRMNNDLVLATSNMRAYQQVAAGNVTTANSWVLQNNAMAQQLQTIRGRIDAERTLIGVTQQRAGQVRQTITNLQQEGASYRQQIPLIQQQISERTRQLRTAQTLHAANQAMGRSDVASATQVAAAQAALTRETTLLARVRLLLRGNTQALAMTEAELTAVLNAETLATERLTAAEAANTLGKRMMAGATLLASGAAKVLSATMNVLLGPLGMAVTMLYMVAQAAGAFETSADRATAAAERMANGFAKAGDAAVLAARKAAISADMASIQKGGMFSVEHGDSWANTGIKYNNDIKGQLAAKQAELDALNNAEVKGARASYINRAQAWQDAVVNGHESYRDRLTLSYNREVKAANQNISDKKALLEREKQLRERYDTKLAGDLQTRMGNLSKMIDARKAKGLNAGPLETALARLQQQNMPAAGNAMTALGGKAAGAGSGMDKFAKAAANADAKVAGVTAAMNGSGKAMAVFNSKLGSGMFKGMSEQQIDSLRRAAAATDMLAAAKKSAGSDNSFESMLGNMAGSLAQMEDQLNETNSGQLDKFNARLKASSDQLGLTAAQIDALRLAAQRLDETKVKIDVKKATEALTDALAKAKAEGDELWTSFNRGTMEADDRLAQIKGRFADKLIGLSGQELENAKNKINEIVDAMQRADAAKTTQGWKDTAEEIRISLLNEDDAREQNYLRELQRQQILHDAIMANASLSADEKRRAEEAYQQWKAGAEKRYERQSETSLVRQARQWMNLGQNIQDTMADALGSVVEGMFNADQNFGDLVKNTLKKILQLIVQAMIAYAIMSAIGMAPTNADGSKQSMGQYLKGGLTKGFSVGGSTAPSLSPGAGVTGMTPPIVAVPTKHTGGVIGSASQTATVAASLFNNAKSYHGGGWIGGRQLKSGEVPMIGLDDEVVLTSDQQRLLANQNGGGGQMPNVQVNVINNSDTQLDAEQGHPEMNGKEMIVNVVVDAMMRQGKMRDAVQQVGSGRG